MVENDRHASILSLLEAVEAEGIGGWVLMLGTGFGARRLLLDAQETCSLEHDFNAADVQRILAAIDADVDESAPWRSFMLGYEAASTLVPRSPRHPHSAALGSAAWVRNFGSCFVLDQAHALWCAQGRGPDLLAVQERLRAGPSKGTSKGISGGNSASPDSGFRPKLSLSTKAKPQHLARVQKCQEALQAGVLYQANLAHPLQVGAADRKDALGWFVDQIIVQAPAYAAIVDDNRGGLLLSLSPECFLRWNLEEGTAHAFPVKGTRPRSDDKDEDERLRSALRKSEKDVAEHVMIVDLLRNDLGRVAMTGGVEVRELLQPLMTRNVHHLQSQVSARLKKGTTPGQLLRATAPGGSITGAPKSAALEVIHELEAGPRGAYTGNLGLLLPNGQGMASILIRTWIYQKEGPGTLHVGGGIVVGSDPEAEWQETLDKASLFGVAHDR